MKLLITLMATTALLLGLATGDHLWWLVSLTYTAAVGAVTAVITNKTRRGNESTRNRSGNNGGTAR